MKGISQDLDSLHTVPTHISTNVGWDENEKPVEDGPVKFEGLEKCIADIMSDCENLFQEISKLLDKFGNGSKSSLIRWQAYGKTEVNDMRYRLNIPT